MRTAEIRIIIGEPDYLALPTNGYVWNNTACGSVYEIILDNILPPRKNCVIFKHFVDVNLAHCILSGKYVTGILHFLNKTSTHSSSNK